MLSFTVLKSLKFKFNNKSFLRFVKSDFSSMKQGPTSRHNVSYLYNPKDFGILYLPHFYMVLWYALLPFQLEDLQ